MVTQAGENVHKRPDICGEQEMCNMVGGEGECGDGGGHQKNLGQYFEDS